MDSVGNCDSLSVAELNPFFLHFPDIHSSGKKSGKADISNFLTQRPNDGDVHPPESTASVRSPEVALRALAKIGASEENDTLHPQRTNGDQRMYVDLRNLEDVDASSSSSSRNEAVVSKYEDLEDHRQKQTKKSGKAEIILNALDQLGADEIARIQSYINQSKSESRTEITHRARSVGNAVRRDRPPTYMSTSDRAFDALTADPSPALPSNSVITRDQIHRGQVPLQHEIEKSLYRQCISKSKTSSENKQSVGVASKPSVDLRSSESPDDRELDFLRRYNQFWSNHAVHAPNSMDQVSLSGSVLSKADTDGHSSFYDFEGPSTFEAVGMKQPQRRISPPPHSRRRAPM